jgi:hypothetical protein
MAEPELVYDLPVTTLPDSPPLSLGGVAEISEEFRVPRTTVSMWDARRATNGFPEPVERLAMGPVYDMRAVRAWHEQKSSK